MAHLWVQGEGEGWTVLPLVPPAFRLAGRPPRPCNPHGRTGRRRKPIPGALVVSCGKSRGGPDAWMVLAGREEGVHINGLPLLLGIRQLRDRDAIQAPGAGTVFFSTESLARIQPAPHDDLAGQCPRCRSAVEAGTLSVDCPACKVRYHQTEDLQCWTYAERCVFCDQATSLDAGYRWTPEGMR
ncbi:MAG: hypothetical protein ACE5HD_01875 [Acidobacteriota bacterium]